MLAVPDRSTLTPPEEPVAKVDDVIRVALAEPENEEEEPLSFLRILLLALGAIHT
jgi:hypothetical protein